MLILPWRPRLLFPRLLRSYRRVAQQDHSCFFCDGVIHPGEEYEGKVWVHGKGKMVISKRHVFPECFPPDDPWEWLQRDEETEGRTDSASSNSEAVRAA